MSTNSERTSAVIYQFPKGGRAAVASYRSAAKPVSQLAALPVIDTDSWYHEAAVENEPNKH